MRDLYRSSFKYHIIKMAILFDEDPYIYYNDTWYNLGDSVEIAEGAGFWLYARIQCTYTLASLGVTVRLIVDTEEVGKDFTSIDCDGAVTTVWVYCTATKEGTAKAELWMGDLSELIETKYSWAVSFPAPYLSIVPTSKIISPVGDWFPLFVVSNVTWEVSDDVTWISCSPTSGSDDDTVTVTVDENTGASSRTGTITIIGGGITRTCTVSQGGTEIYLIISPTIHSSPAAGDGFPITVTSNLGWTVTANRPWISCSPPSGSGDDTVAVTVDANTETSSRTGTVYIEGAGITRTCVITQAWLEPVECSDYTDALTCVSEGCYWWSDGTCHDIEEPPPDYELIASDNTPKTVKEPSGTQTIKELDIPVGKQSGDYKVKLSFTTPYPRSVIARLLDQDGNEIWGDVITSSPYTKEIEFHSDNLTKLVVERRDSGNLDLTSNTFEVYRKKIIETCDQLVKVVNPALDPIEDAIVGVQISETESIVCYTDANGFCYIQGLTIDSIYTACASKEGYERYGDDGCKIFTACSPFAVILTLYKPCEQGFGVRDQDDEPIEGATVTVTGGATCTTDANGCCSIMLDANLSYNAEATKDGYVCYGSECRQENFMCVPDSALPLKLQKATCSQQFALRDKDTALHIPDATVEVGGVPCTELPAIERYQINNLTIGSPYIAIASKAGYECPDTLCEKDFTADPANPAYNLYLEEIPTVDNYDIVFCVSKSVWGFDWIANNFVSKVLPKITSALNATSISDLVVHGEASYYDAEKKQIIINADIPSHSPLAPVVLWLILTMVLPALIMLGVYVKETFFDKKGVEPVTVTLRTIDIDSNPITEPISLTVNGVTKTTSGGVASFVVNENFQVQCVGDTWDIFDSTKWYEPTTAMQDVILSSTATRNVKMLVKDEAGNPLPNKEVHILDAYGKYIRTATTDENGYVTLKMGAGEYTIVVINEQGIPTGTTDIDSGTEDIEEEIIVPEGYAMRVYARETGTSNYIDGATITVDSKTGTTDGRNGVLIADLEDKNYTITAQHPSYNNGDVVTYPEAVNPTTVLEDIIIDMEHTGEDALVRIYPRYETTNLVAAKVQLEGFVEKTTAQLGFVEYSNVSHGEYSVTATKQDFTQKEPSKKYSVDESHTIEGVVTIVVVMESGLIPPPPPPPTLSMLLIYGVATVGLYVAGMFVPKGGKVVQVSAIIPAGLGIFEGYKYVKEKIPFLGTELEQLALPPKLTETLRKKKLVVSQ